MCPVAVHVDRLLQPAAGSDLRNEERSRVHADHRSDKGASQDSDAQRRHARRSPRPAVFCQP